MNSIQFPAEPTPAWLSMVLRQSGFLETGEVKLVKIENTDAFNSQTIRLTLIYSPDAPDTAPEHLILKRNTQESWAIQAGKDEVRFYQFASDWTWAQQQAGQVELNLLQSYYARLLANCVQDYTWDNLLSDYQAGLVAWVLMPVQDGADGASKQLGGLKCSVS